MLGFLPAPLLIWRAARADPAELVASFAANESDHLTIGQKAERRFVGMAGDVKVRNEVIIDAVAAGHQLELPIGGASFDFSCFCRLLRGRGGALLGVIRYAVRFAVVPGHSP